MYRALRVMFSLAILNALAAISRRRTRSQKVTASTMECSSAVIVERTLLKLLKAVLLCLNLLPDQKRTRLYKLNKTKLYRANSK